mgnify:FL=1
MYVENNDNCTVNVVKHKLIEESGIEVEEIETIEKKT